MKTKAFSKEGLGQSAKQDPRERARSEIRDWLNTTVDTLNLQARRLCTTQHSILAHYGSGNMVHLLTSVKAGSCMKLARLVLYHCTSILPGGRV